MSPRRIGKTGLIRHCFAQHELKDNYNTFLIDIHATQDIRDFVNIFGKPILDALRLRGKKAWEAFIGALKVCAAQLSFDIKIYKIGFYNPSFDGTFCTCFDGKAKLLHSQPPEDSVLYYRLHTK